VENDQWLAQRAAGSGATNLGIKQWSGFREAGWRDVANLVTSRAASRRQTYRPLRLRHFHSASIVENCRIVVNGSVKGVVE
jgi:hypothetical protein